MIVSVSRVRVFSPNSITWVKHAKPCKTLSSYFMFVRPFPHVTAGSLGQQWVPCAKINTYCFLSD